MNFCKVIFCILFVFSSNVYLSKAEDDIQSYERLNYFLQNFYGKPDYVVNQFMVALHYGTAFPKIQSSLLEDDTFVNAFELSFDYGFIRIDSLINPRLGLSGIFKHTSEYFFLSNISTNFKTFAINKEGMNIDAWRFGFGLKDGFGYEYDNKEQLLLNHATTFNWTRIDLDRFSNTEELNSYLNRFYRELRFGQSFSSGISYKFSKYWLFDTGFEHSLIYPHFDAGKWIPMWLLDNILQRWLDYYELDMLSAYETKYPLMKFLYKSILSAALFEVRRKSMFFPFGSGRPFSFYNYNIGIKYVF